MSVTTAFSFSTAFDIYLSRCLFRSQIATARYSFSFRRLILRICFEFVPSLPPALNDTFTIYGPNMQHRCLSAQHIAVKVFADFVCFSHYILYFRTVCLTRWRHIRAVFSAASYGRSCSSGHNTTHAQTYFGRELIKCRRRCQIAARAISRHNIDDIF